MNKINCSLLPFGIFKSRSVKDDDSEQCLPCESSIEPARALHYVLRVTSRPAAIEFFTKLLGMKVLRHEEFSEGCGPACVGSCGTLWSKTMVGYGPEDHYFAFELVYDYGVTKSTKSNAVLGIYIKSKEILKRAANRKVQVKDGNSLTSPSGYKFYIIDEPQPQKQDPVEKICLNSSNIRNSIKYWHDLLAFELVELNHKKKLAGFSYKTSTIIIQFQESGEEIIHGFGRIVFSCPSANLSKLEKLIARSKHKIVYPLTTVKNPGQHPYRILVIADPDDHEVCFYDEQSFRKISKYSPDAAQILNRYIALETGEEPEKSPKTCRKVRSKTKPDKTQTDPAENADEGNTACDERNAACGCSDSKGKDDKNSDKASRTTEKSNRSDPSQKKEAGPVTSFTKSTQSDQDEAPQTEAPVENAETTEPPDTQSKRSANPEGGSEAQPEEGQDRRSPDARSEASGRRSDAQSKQSTKADSERGEEEEVSPLEATPSEAKSQISGPLTEAGSNRSPTAPDDDDQPVKSEPDQGDAQDGSEGAPSEQKTEVNSDNPSDGKMVVAKKSGDSGE